MPTFKLLPWGGIASPYGRTGSPSCPSRSSIVTAEPSLLWHREDSAEAVRAQQRLASRLPQAGWKRLENSQLRELEPALNSRLSHAAYISGEAQVEIGNS